MQVSRYYDSKRTAGGAAAAGVNVFETRHASNIAWRIPIVRDQYATFNYILSNTSLQE